MIDKILPQKDCTGCRACINICPFDSINSEYIDGFFFPSVDYDKCKMCKKCLKVCPIITRPSSNTAIAAYACKNLDETVRGKSSSGGIFSTVAKKVINSKGLVCGAIFDNDFKVKHILIESLNDLPALYGSKYLQSDINDVYIRISKELNSGRFVFFSGTPCQCAGLKSFLQKDYDNLFIADIVCHGVPSPKVWSKYLETLQKKYKSKIDKVNFRSKKSGWLNFAFIAEFDNGQRLIQSHKKNLYMQVFLKNLSLRETCYNCNFKGKSRFSDITLADFWGVEDIMPDMYDDKGTSLTIINTKKGELMFDDLKKDLNYLQTDIDKALLYNSAAVMSVPYNKNRAIFFTKLGNKKFVTLCKKYLKIPLHLKIKNKIYIKLKKFERAKKS